MLKSDGHLTEVVSLSRTSHGPVLLQHGAVSSMKNADVAGRTAAGGGGAVFCVGLTAEGNSIFQGDDVRSANKETGESQ